jgi:hypothetical protein
MRILERRGVQFIAVNTVEPKRIGMNLSDSPVCPKWVIFDRVCGLCLPFDVRFSNRPPGVKRFQTIRHHSDDVARGLVLLFGIGTRALVWGFFCQGVRQSGKSFVLRQFLCSISKPVSSSRPAGSLTSSRAGAVKVGRRANLAACSELARPYLDSFEHDGTLGAIGMTIRGEPAFGRGSVAPQPCIRWIQGPEP